MKVITFTCDCGKTHNYRIGTGPAKGHVRKKPEKNDSISSALDHLCSPNPAGSIQKKVLVDYVVILFQNAGLTSTPTTQQIGVEMKARGIRSARPVAGAPRVWVGVELKRTPVRR